MDDNRRMLDEMRQPYRTPAERAEDRKKFARPGLSNTSPERPEDAPAPKVVVNVWEVQSQKGGPIVYIRCPSRSGAKIYAHNTLKMEQPFHTDVVAPESLPEDTVILEPVFETVPEYAARIERENKEKRR